MILATQIENSRLFELSALALVGGLIWLFWTMAIKRERPHYGARALVTFSAILLLIALYNQDSAPGPGLRSQCRDKFRMIGLALQEYRDVRKQFPPAATLDPNGNPLHSWRTLLLPYIDGSQIYSQLNLSEPWNSPRNAKILQHANELFRCPSEKSGRNNETSYVAILGPGTAWQPGVPLKGFKDRPEDTILLVEMKNSGIYWGEPGDLDLGNLPPGITTFNLIDSLSEHPSGFHAVFADGRTILLSKKIPWKVFMAMLTIAGGETIDPNWSGR